MFYVYFNASSGLDFKINVKHVGFLKSDVRNESKWRKRLNMKIKKIMIQIVAAITWTHQSGY